MIYYIWMTLYDLMYGVLYAYIDRLHLIILYEEIIKESTILMILYALNKIIRAYM